MVGHLGENQWPRSKVRASMVPLRILAMFRPRKIFPRRRGAAVAGEIILCIYTICNTCCICHVRMCSNNDSTSNARTHTHLYNYKYIVIYIYTHVVIYVTTFVYIYIYIYVCMFACIQNCRCMRVFPRCAAQCVYIYIYICHIYIDVQTRISCFDWAINASITNPYANRRVRKQSWLVESSPNSSQQSATYSGFPYVFQFFSH